MTSNHPITPPPELVQQWMYVNDIQITPLYMVEAIATQAARWGADQELEACCNWVSEATPWAAYKLRDARRSKPPSLKALALAELDLLKGDANAHGLGFDAPAIRKALEQLPE